MRHLLLVLALLVLLTPPCVKAHLEPEPLYAAAWNESSMIAFPLEAKLLGYLKRGYAIELLMHAEAGQAYHGCKADARVSAGPLRVEIVSEVEQTLLTKVVHVYLRVWEYGKKVFERKLKDIGWLDGHYKFDFNVILEFREDGELEYRIIGEDVSYSGSISLVMSSIAIVAEGEENGVCLKDLCTIKCVSWVKTEKKWRIGEGEPEIEANIKVGGESEDAGLDPELAREVVNKAVVAMVAIAALFAIPLALAAFRKPAALLLLLLPLSLMLLPASARLEDVTLAWGSTNFRVNPGEWAEFRLEAYAFVEDGWIRDFLSSTASIEVGDKKVTISFNAYPDLDGPVIEFWIAKVEPEPVRTLYERKIVLTDGEHMVGVKVVIDYCGDEPVVKLSGDFSGTIRLGDVERDAAKVVIRWASAEDGSVVLDPRVHKYSCPGSSTTVPRLPWQPPPPPTRQPDIWSSTSTGHSNSTTLYVALGLAALAAIPLWLYALKR